MGELKESMGVNEYLADANRTANLLKSHMSVSRRNINPQASSLQPPPLRRGSNIPPQQQEHPAAPDASIAQPQGGINSHGHHSSLAHEAAHAMNVQAQVPYGAPTTGYQGLSQGDSEFGEVSAGLYGIGLAW